jgi:exopolyphosphatase / guanosine-5'-triphosphate,3'-diphosphate pyrophosphatase
VIVGIIDLGSNSTRLLVADVEGGEVHELERRSEVTRLGEGVDGGGSLGAAGQERVFAVLREYTAALDRRGVERRLAVMTSAVRDAANGAEFAAAVRERFGLEARILSGDEEARLTFLGATAARDAGGAPLVVIDIGGGSTELVVGTRGEVRFHVSTQAGVVRHTERHLHADPPEPGELDALARDVQGIFDAAVPAEVREGVARGVAVAGTPTSCAAIELGLDPYDAARVEGHVLARAHIVTIRATLSALTAAERRDVTGLHPDRAPTIVAGITLLIEAMDAFGLDSCEVSERDILWGAALEGAPES